MLSGLPPLPPPPPPPPGPSVATIPALPRPTIASALPLLPATATVGATASVSPLRGTPSSRSSKPFRLIGAPATQVPVPELPSLRLQL